MSDFVRLPPRGGGRGRGNHGGRHHGGGRRGGWRGRGGNQHQYGRGWHGGGGGGRSSAYRGRGGGGRGGRGRGGRSQNNSAANVNFNADAAMIQEITPPPRPGTERPSRTLRIAIQGCCHGSLDSIYSTLQARSGPPIDLLLCCGDFQAIRNLADLETIAVPAKYRDLGTFWRYYSGQRIAPITTIFIGGNHEASGYLQELFYGGWVAPNIYYLGAAGVVRFGGLRIGGISGIYKSHDFTKGRHEAPPYDRGTIRSVYHTRNVEVYRMKCLSSATDAGSTSTTSSAARRPLDIVLSHDWPRGIERFGDTAALLRKKKFFRQEVEENNLGSPANEDILNTIKPRWWFSAHLHVKFDATVRHSGEQNQYKQGSRKQPDDSASSLSGLVPSQVATSTSISEIHDAVAPKPSEEANDHSTNSTSFVGLESACPTENSVPDLADLMTRFLSLDKCLPRREHLQIINLPIPSDGASSISPPKIEYDAEWLAILRKTHNLTQHNSSYVSVPHEVVTATDEDIAEIQLRLHETHRSQEDTEEGATGQEQSAATTFTIIPENFSITVPPHGSSGSEVPSNGGAMVGNPQTDNLLNILGLDHIITVPFNGTPCQRQAQTNFVEQKSADDNEINLDDDDEEEEDGHRTGNGFHPLVDQKGGQLQEELKPTDDNEIDIDDDVEDDDLEDENEIDLDEVGGDEGVDAAQHSTREGFDTGREGVVDGLGIGLDGEEQVLPAKKARTGSIVE